MRLARLSLLSLSVCLVFGLGCNRKKPSDPATRPAFSVEAIQQVAEAEKSPQASLELLNELLKDWLLRRNQFPKNLQEFVTAGMLPRLPLPPPGKRFVIDSQHGRVVLANE